MSPWLAILGTAITAIAGVIGVMYTARSSRQAQAEAARATAEAAAQTAAETARATAEAARTAPYAEMYAELRDARERMDRQDETIRALREEVAEVRSTARDAHHVAEQAIAENAELVDYTLATARGVAAGTVPPWLPIPYTLRHRLTEADLPLVPPAPTDAVPDPADDGQDRDHTTD
ncbi:hypothetical protein [Ornithinimicrobium cerasi]|uniref:hypothetical protein n=1 Tax=Ornithinimicrobium cerasi TaxID=2248773 RepID=UPI000F000641|nr:hypothetical protein [Ornithinimicrobium cerasi]